MVLSGPRSNRGHALDVKREMTIRRVLFFVFLVSIPVTAQNRAAPTRIELAPGIFLFTTPSDGDDVGLDGNSIAVLSRDGVLVFDTNGTRRRPRRCSPRSVS